MNQLKAYIELNPTKKELFLAIQKSYEQGLRHACNEGDSYVVDLLIDFATKEGFKLNLMAASTNGKTAHHWAAIYANKTGDLTCLKKLLDYSLEQSVAYDFPKDKLSKTFEDYLNGSNKELYEAYQLEQVSRLMGIQSECTSNPK